MFWFGLIVILVLLIPLLALVLDSQLGRALAARLETRGLGPAEDVLAERVGFLEGEVERLTGDVDRLEEQTEFLHKLLAGRKGGDNPALPSGEEGAPGEREA